MAPHVPSATVDTVHEADGADCLGEGARSVGGARGGIPCDWRGRWRGVGGKAGRVGCWAVRAVVGFADVMAGVVDAQLALLAAIESESESESQLPVQMSHVRAGQDPAVYVDPSLSVHRVQNFGGVILWEAVLTVHLVLVDDTVEASGGSDVRCLADHDYIDAHAHADDARRVEAAPETERSFGSHSSCGHNVLDWCLAHELVYSSYDNDTAVLREAWVEAVAL